MTFLVTPLFLCAIVNETGSEELCVVTRKVPYDQILKVPLPDLKQLLICVRVETQFHHVCYAAVGAWCIVRCEGNNIAHISSHTWS